MNGFVPFVGLSLVVHLTIIVLKTSSNLYQAFVASKQMYITASYKIMRKYFSLLIVTSVVSSVSLTAGLIIRSSITDEDSNARILISLAQKLEDHSAPQVLANETNMPFCYSNSNLQKSLGVNFFDKKDIATNLSGSLSFVANFVLEDYKNINKQDFLRLNKVQENKDDLGGCLSQLRTL